MHDLLILLSVKDEIKTMCKSTGRYGVLLVRNGRNPRFAEFFFPYCSTRNDVFEMNYCLTDSSLIGKDNFLQGSKSYPYGQESISL